MESLERCLRRLLEGGWPEGPHTHVLLWQLERIREALGSRGG